MKRYHNFSFDSKTSVLDLSLDYISDLSEIDKNKIFSEIQKKRKNLSVKKILERKITDIFITPSMNCLGNCLYCYNSKEIHSNSGYMNLNILEESISKLEEKFGKISSNNTRIYGGEPFLCPDLFDLIRYMDNRFSPRFYMSSGLLFTDTQFLRLLENVEKNQDITKKVSLGVSIDLFSSTRKNNFGIDQEELIRRARSLKEYFADVILATTISSSTDIDALIRYYQNSSDNDFYNRLSIACVDDMDLSVKKEDLKKIYDFMSENLNSKITTNIMPYLDVLSTPRRIKLQDNVYLLEFNPTHCGAFNSMINIMPDGSFAHCHMNPTDHSIRLNDFKDCYEFINDPICDKCHMQNICRNGCFYRKKMKNRNIYCYWSILCFDLALQRIDKILDEIGIENFDKISDLYYPHYRKRSS